MDHGIEAKQLQDILHADENSINGWECRGIYPSGDYLRRVVEFIDANQTEPIPRKPYGLYVLQITRLTPKD